MALIKCPECGRENVSDTAESCPNCGYGIKSHLERQKQERHTNAKIQRTQEEKLKGYESEIRKKQAEIDNISCPQEPPTFLAYMFRKEVCIMSCVIMVGPLLTLLICFTAGIDNAILILYAVLGLLATPIWLFIGHGDYKNEIKAYKRELALYNTNKKEWERQKENRKAWVESSYKLAAQHEAEAIHKKPETSLVKCPICGSDTVEKITTMDRSVSVAMVGLASGKIGKQYKCKKCKHMW